MLSERVVAQRVVYLTFDGVLQPLGYSQVVRVIAALARRGHRYSLISLERAPDLAKEGPIARVRETLDRAGISWVALPYESGTRGVAQNVRRATWALSREVARGGVSLIHARGYHSALCALAIRAATRTPYLFDARGYWVDERIDERRWFTGPASIAAARFLERRMYTEADGVVTLTALHADDVRAGKFGPHKERPVGVIPTLCDFDDFAPRPRSARHVPEVVRARLEGKRVIGLIGSVNVSYRMRESARLIAEVLRRDPRFVAFVVTGNHEAMTSILGEQGVPAARTIVASAAHDVMPEFLSWMDWVVLLLTRSVAKRGSMPTKLGELFAMGVRPVATGCNDEMCDWVRRCGSGIVLDDADEASLSQGAERITQDVDDRAALDRAREIARPHFALTEGVARYSALLEAMGARSGA